MREFQTVVPAAAICALLLVAPVPGPAQTTRPETSGLATDRLERVAELMQREIDARSFAGAVTLIARNGNVVWLEAQGLMDIDANRRMREDAVFRIMSMTKPIVAISILMLMEEGKVRLTDPVSRFVPEFADSPVTVRDLLTHTAGLMTTGGASEGYDVEIAASDSLADVVPRLAAVPLDFEPGTQWAYSGQFAFDVLAHIVERASGTPFDQFTEARIFGPLHMRDTAFYPAGDKDRIATVYRATADGLVHQQKLASENGVYFSGGGGLFSTAEDYVRFAQMLLNGGELDGARLVSRRSVTLMASPSIPDSLPGRTAGEGYGLGVRVVTDPAARITLLSPGSFGWSGAFNTHFFIDPEEELIGIFMTQSAFFETRQQLRDDFETAVMQALID
jgi:CubicO group peptidase (beta-lactamase class C family)